MPTTLDYEKRYRRYNNPKGLKGDASLTNFWSTKDPEQIRKLYGNGWRVSTTVVQKKYRKSFWNKFEKTLKKR